MRTICRGPGRLSSKAKTVDPSSSGSESGSCDDDVIEEIYLHPDGSFPEYGPAFEKGTTTLAFIFNEGIMVAADHSRNLSNSAPNVVELHSHMLATLSGGSESMLRELQQKCHQHEVNEGRRPEFGEVLKWLRQTLSSYGEKELPSGILIAVWDEKKPGLYRIRGRGEVLEDSILATGSGSGGAYAILDTQHHDDMSETEAAKLANRALCVAAHAAPKTGDLVSVYHLGRMGSEQLFTVDVVEWQKENLKVPRCKYVVIGPGW
ncbi:OLC1v1031311C3 [Oldenlandia corymbosa var. corymbosa]|uniref:OLC1v1031311C3 n=1 Tax=Oldenlandia corymbosa var. corymbosa TaxID=529605 RepID=A0AAV1CI68_OLDCO|nr:OLC1v1031311C3 [Oldenlandia corymbosa var. corymbosa]